MVKKWTSHHHLRLHSSRKAFSLIELLVTLSIISVLAAILFPLFMSAQENARDSSCRDNLKQIGLGLLQYAQDYDQKNVWVSSGTNGDGDSDPKTASPSYKWMDAVYPYAKSEELFVCPSDSKNLPYVYYGRLAAPAKKYGSYAMNTAYWGGTFGGNPAGSALTDGGKYHNPNGAAATQIANPAGTIWIVEGESSMTHMDKRGPGNPWKDIASNPAVDTSEIDNVPRLRYSVARHEDTMNILYSDGHVQNQKLTSLVHQGVDGQYTLFTTEAD